MEIFVLQSVKHLEQHSTFQGKSFRYIKQGDKQKNHQNIGRLGYLNSLQNHGEFAALGLHFIP